MTDQPQPQPAPPPPDQPKPGESNPDEPKKPARATPFSFTPGETNARAVRADTAAGTAAPLTTQPVPTTTAGTAA